ncbi:MAG: 2Fe-2S iron-sulfur cluster-binding protein [Candidatus Sericytochromatia bacterium]|nr:2Fe-2S iron-sulfur cluster-binding protein [Candidatus Sericytochromatia bacterium]
MALVTINGQTLEVPDGTNVVEAAASAGVDIPHYCYHPGLPIDGNCRMCLVEVEGARGPQIACNTILRTTRNKEGEEVPAAVVKTETDAVRQMRQGVMEFLLLNHPIDCPVCDQAGECGLQDYYMEHGKHDHRSVVPKVEKLKAQPIGPNVILDQERCILCSRCVRFTREVTRTHELVIAGRGDKSRIEVFPGTQLDNDYATNVVDLCPVGALTSRDFRFKKRVWFLKTASSICTGCSRGCNVHLDHDGGKAYRYRPRANPDVNRWWMCDRGRFTYKAIHEGRQREAAIGGQQVPFAKATQELRQLLGTGKVGFVVGAQASLEDMAVVKWLAASIGGRAWGLDWTEPGKEDDFLMKADLTPNRRGFSMIGLETDETSFREALPALSALVTVSVTLPAGIAHARTAALVTHAAAIPDGAAVVLPVAMHAERHAAYANVDGIVQHVEPAFEPAGDALPASALLALQAAGMGHSLPFDRDGVWKRLDAELGVTA